MKNVGIVYSTSNRRRTHEWAATANSIHSHDYAVRNQRARSRKIVQMRAKLTAFGRLSTSLLFMVISSAKSATESCKRQTKTSTYYSSKTTHTSLRALIGRCVRLPQACAARPSPDPAILLLAVGVTGFHGGTRDTTPSGECEYTKPSLLNTIANARRHELFKVGNLSIFKSYLLHHLQ